MDDIRTTAWLLRSVQALRGAGSWTGRTHIHKHLFLTGELLKVKHPFVFELYKFGPYSFDIDTLIRELISLGLICAEEISEGYGPTYDVSANLDEILSTSNLDIDEEDREALLSVAGAIGDRTSSDLEVIATCLWARRRDGLEEADDVVRRVLELKPRYDEKFVRSKLKELDEIEVTLGN